MRYLMKLAAIAIMVPAVPLGARVLFHHENGAAAEIPSQTQAPREVVTFTGEGSGARVTRTRTAAGGEALHGETELTLGVQAPVRVVEDVLLDRRGWLARAEVTVTSEPGGKIEARTTLDAARGLVTVQSVDGAVTWRAASDAPWTYVAEGAAGRQIATPVAAWVMMRASQAASSVRQIDRGAQRAWLVPRDQIAVADEAETTVVLGDQGADVNGRFVVRVRNAGHVVMGVSAPQAEVPAM